MRDSDDDSWLDDQARRRRTNALLVSLRELSVLMTRAIEESAGDAVTSNSVVLGLTNLAHHGRLRSARLGRLAHLSRGGISNMIRRLEADGLIERTHGGDDGRAVWVSLTEAGKELESRLCDAVVAELATSQPIVKDALMPLVELGVSMPGAERPTTDRARRVTMALGEAGALITPALVRAGSHACGLALASLEAEGPCRIGRLGGLLGITSGGATHLVDQLVALGQVERRASLDDDARGIEVHLTPEGVRVLSELATDLEPVLPAIMVALRSAVIDLGDLA